MKKPDPRTLDSVARLYKAFADPVRLRLLTLLVGREVCVCHLHEALELPQPTVSRHLASLRAAGIVETRKQGLWVYYRLTAPADAVGAGLIAGLVSLVDLPAFARDRDRLERMLCC
ncbi:MAG: metalloregulator ArsR/SmtB family transcription factor [Isosphaeraceae bacterium]|nr:metalloregulator ArsR/SmtB family transcription factor [Isosphaeraceae bacterium]